MKSIRSRIVTITFAGVALICIVLCVTLYITFRQILINHFDQELLSDFRSIAAITKVWPDGDIYVELDTDITIAYRDGNKAFQVWTADGRKSIDRSPLLMKHKAELDRLVQTPLKKPALYDLNFPDGRPARAAIQIVEAEWGWYDRTPGLEVPASIRELEVLLVVAKESETLNHSLQELFYLMAILTIVSPVLLLTAVTLTVSRGLTPLSRLRSVLADIRSTKAPDRLYSEWPEEIQPVVNTLGDMLARLDQAFLRERRFTSDASHELRTPLSELRTATDVALRAGDRPERLLKAVKQANYLSVTMTQLVNSLLMLARYQRREVTLEKESLDMSDLLKGVIEQFDEKIQKKNVQWQLNLTEELIIDTDCGLLLSVMNNLIDNAVEYTPANSQIEVSLGATPVGFNFVIQNPAPGLTQSDVEQIFEAFWRKESSRTAREHYGLGLTLTKEACQFLGIELNANLTSDGLLRFSLNKQD